MLTPLALALAVSAWHSSGRADGGDTGPATATAAASTAASTAPSTAPSTVAPLSEAELQAGREQAYALHDEGKYAAAAAALERLHVASGERADLLFEAGQSRFAAGHRAHALRHFEAYLRAPNLSADDRALAESRAQAAMAGTTLLTVVVRPADAQGPGTRVTADFADATDGQERPPLAVEEPPTASAEGLSYALRLDPGRWQITVAAPGQPAANTTAELTAGAPARAYVTLAPPRTDTPTPGPAKPVDGTTPARASATTSSPRSRSSTPMIAGLAAGAVVGVGAGVGLTATGARRFVTAFVPCPTEPGCSESEIFADVRMTGAGTALLGAGLGLAVTATAARFVRTPTPWYAQLGLGGALLLTGTVWTAVSNLRHHGFDDVTRYESSIDAWLAGRSIGTAVLGAGAGLVVGSGVALLGQRRARTRGLALAPIAGGGQLGLRLIGRF